MSTSARRSRDTRLRAGAATLLALLAACGGGEDASDQRADTDTPLRRSAATELDEGLEDAGGSGSALELVDVTEALGIAFHHDNGARGRYYFPETFGSGVALLDANEDGRLDVYCVQSGVLPGSPEDLAEQAQRRTRPANELWLASDSGRFRNATAESGAAADDGFGMGVSVGDVNGDGDPDLYLTNWGPDRLLLGGAGASFARATGEPRNERWSTASGFADFDRDGHLDLVAVNYLHWTLDLHRDCDGEGGVDYCDVSLFEGLSDFVWRGDGRGGFEDRSREWGLAQRAGKGLGLALVDLDDDGDVDLYVANDTEANFVWLNRLGEAELPVDGQELRFEDATDVSGAAYGVDGRPQAGMGVTVADLDDDGLPEVHVTNFTGESNALYANQGAGRFRDRARQSGLTAASRNPLGFGTTFEDLDGDGVLDLYVTNGHVLRHVGELREAWQHAQPDLLFRGRPNGRFAVWDAGPALAVATVGRAVAKADLDGDGTTELVLTASGGPLRVLRAQPAEGPPRMLRVELVGGSSNTLAIGARVTLRFADGSLERRWVVSGTGYLSQDDLAPRFALPPGRAAEALEVRWPDGATTTHALAGDTPREVRLAR